MIVACLDTSAINNLMDDPRRDTLTARLLGEYDVYLTSLNVIETSKTASPHRRERLRAFQKDQLSKGYEPLELPNHLIRLATRLFHERKHRALLTITGDRRSLWEALSQPNLVGETERQVLTQWARQLEDDNATSNAQLRADFEQLFQQGTPRPSSPAQLLRVYLKAGWPLHYHIPAQVYKRETGRVLPLSRLDSLLDVKPSFWKLFLAAYAFSIFYSAVWHPDYHGPRNRAGIIDLLFAVYLPLCDVFVTHDTARGGQYEALRLLNAFNSRRPRTHVLTWEQFRSRLVGTAS